jgi:hypothetical protein
MTGHYFPYDMILDIYKRKNEMNDKNKKVVAPVTTPDLPAQQQDERGNPVVPAFVQTEEHTGEVEKAPV